MTRRVLHDLGCVCGRHFCRTLYHAIDVTQQTGLRYAVLAGVLNVVQCPSCERIARVNLPFLYRDSARGRLIYVYPAEAEEQADALQSQIVQMVDTLEAATPSPENLPRPTTLFGVERLSALIAGDLGEGENIGSIAFDVRPGIKSERTGRVLANRVALQAGGYAYGWREGGRLHLQVFGPSAALEQMTIEIE